LAANAVKFTKGGVVKIACVAERDSVCFNVADNGPGIAADKLRQICEPYVQLNGPLLDRYGGTGLGLAISREFAAGMRGELTVRSEVGKGWLFSLTLPRASVREAPQVRTRSHDDQPPAVA